MLKITLYSSQWQEPLSHIMVTEFTKCFAHAFYLSLSYFSIQLFVFFICHHFQPFFRLFFHHCAIIFHFKNMIIFRLKFKTLELSAREMELWLFFLYFCLFFCVIFFHTLFICKIWSIAWMDLWKIKNWIGKNMPRYKEQSIRGKR